MGGPGVAMFCSSVMEAAPLVGLPRALRLLRGVQEDCCRLAPQLSPWQVMYIIEAYSDAVEARYSNACGPPLWRGQEEVVLFLEALGTRAGKTIRDPSRLRRASDHVNRIAFLESL